MPTTEHQTMKLIAERRDEVTINGVPYTVTIVNGVTTITPGPAWLNSRWLRCGGTLLSAAFGTACMLVDYPLIGLIPAGAFIATLAVLEKHYAKRSDANEREADDV